MTKRLMVELFSAEPGSIVQVEQSAEGKNPNVASYTAKVGHADRRLRNPRVYTREAWAGNIGRLRDEGGLKRGAITGGNSHDVEAGDRCIVWRGLELHDDGSVIGRFDVSRAHPEGAKLIAQIEMGMEVSFSTVALTSARPAIEADAKRYGFAPELWDSTWIIEQMELRRVDSVGTPSCYDAKLIERIEHALNGDAADGKGAAKEGDDAGASNPDVKDFAELQTAYPEIVNKGVGEAVAAATSPLVATINKLIESVKGVAGVELPHREVLPAETADRIAKLEADLAAADAAKVAAEQAKVALETEKATLEAAKAIEGAKAEAKAKLDAALKVEGKDIRFAESIKAVVLPLIESGALKADGVEAAVVAKGTEYESIAKAIAPANPNALDTKTGADPALSAQDEEAEAAADEELAKGGINPTLAKLYAAARES